VVFHPPSGDTLFLDPASALLLEILADGSPHTAPSLYAAAAARLSLPVPSQDDRSADREPAKAGTPTLVYRLQAVSGPDQEALVTRAQALLDRLDRLGLLDRWMP
jgi:PqqD family protein of HPr-rel-A system